jgi:hypothetical protein
MRNRDPPEARAQFRNLPLQPIEHGLTRGNRLRQRGSLAGFRAPAVGY